MNPTEREPKTATDLEWPLLLGRIAAHCHSAVAAQALGQLRPEATLEAARGRMQRTREAIALERLAPIPTARIEDQSTAFDQVARGAALDGNELRALTVTLESSQRLRSYLERHAEGAPGLRAWLATSPGLAQLEDALRRSIGPDGAVLDSASPALRRARQRAQELRHELRQRLSQMLGKLGEAVQGQYLAERDGRYVLPVRADAPFRVDGLVLGSSASGGTLYVEPRETHDLGNRVQVAEAEVRVEEARVLRELNGKVASQIEDVRQAQSACAQADCLRALALYARQSDALPFEPRAEACLRLVKMRHPLLLGEGREVVANDLSLERGRGLILSGPNAGGKTVALKCLGLAAWMVRSGVPIPANESSELGWFDRVLTDVGDNQSLMHSLSTFSAHVENVGACVQNAAAGTLVLIDELAGGTDPDEGAALACAVVEALVARGAAVCVTTHYERLKSLAADHPRLDNAAVGFDRERLLPTFRIDAGAPGASSALLVARRFGLEPDVIARAEALLPEGIVNQRALVEQLEQERQRWHAAVAEAEAERRQVAELRQKLEQERKRAAAEERRHLALETQSVLEEVRGARNRLRQAEARLKNADAGPSSVLEARRAVNDAAQFVAIGGKLIRASTALDPTPEPAAEAPSWEGLALGSRVALRGLGATGEVVAKPRRDQVTVAVGSMKTTVNISALSLTPGGLRPRLVPASPQAKARAKPASSALPRESGREGGDPLRTSANTCNLIGKRVEEGLEQLEIFIDQLLREGEPFGYALHGHGTGALKSAVRQHLQKHRAVSHAEPAEREDGGDAFTVFWLR